jgi:hypothetical protein
MGKDLRVHPAEHRRDSEARRDADPRQLGGDAEDSRVDLPSAIPMIRAELRERGSALPSAPFLPERARVLTEGAARGFGRSFSELHATRGADVRDVHSAPPMPVS